MSGTQQRTLGGGGHQVLDYLKRLKAENPAFFYAVQSDIDHVGGNIFWADATCKTNYSYFGDAVILDTTYKTNQYRVPFASFTGFNHHGQPVLFGCALIVDESDSSYIWLFRTWLHAMSERHPVSITTDLDPVIQVVVAQVFPPTRHRFYTGSIFRENRSKLARLCQSHPTFETEFKKSVVEKRKKIQELTAELETTNQRCNVYRVNLIAVLRDMEEQKLKLSVKVQNARLSLKE